MSICILSGEFLSLMQPPSQPCPYLSWDCVIIKKCLRPRKLNGITLDEDEMNSLSDLIKQLGPTHHLCVALSR